MPRHTWTDEEMLEALHLHEAEGLNARDVAERIGARFGAEITRMSVIGTLNRIRKETDAHDETPHLNGSMPPQWWRAGLKTRRDPAAQHGE